MCILVDVMTMAVSGHIWYSPVFALLGERQFIQALSNRPQNFLLSNATKGVCSYGQETSIDEVLGQTNSYANCVTIQKK